MTKRLTFAALVVCALGAYPAAQGSGTKGAPTFSKDVAPILYKNCTGCHRPGEIAPMSLLTYKEARPWAKSIGTRVANGTMPPWHADPAYGHFLNDRSLSADDKATIAKWVAAGAPEGSAKDLPPQPQYADGWTIGQPDAVFAMQEDYPIPASGEVAYQYFEIPTNLTEDRYVQAFEVKAGNPKVVHHVIVYARPPAPSAPPPPPAATTANAAPAQRPVPVFEFAPGMEIPAGQTGGRPLPPEQRKKPGPNDRLQPRMGPSIGGFAPGQFMRVYQEGTAMKVPAGATLIFQMHYTTMGTATTDRTRIGVKFAKGKPETELIWASLANGGLKIPAGASDARVDAEMTINRDVTMWSMLPHTHVRGKRWNYEITYPDGKKETILAVPRYDFNWQTDYVFEQPLKIPKGTKIHATAWYDNSTANKSNPDPTKDVTWGDQTWEEMMFTGLTLSIDRPKPANSAGQQQ